MAEPAQIYDPDQKEPVTRPDLQVLEGGGETSPPTGDLYVPSGSADIAEKERKADSKGDKDQNEAEASRHPNQVGKGHTGKGEEPRSIRSLFKTRKRKLIGLGTGLIGGGIIGFILFFLPVLRLESYLASINRRVFAASESAVSNRIEHLAERFMILHVLNLESCGGVINAGCRADYSTMGPAGGLFNAWRDARIEQKIIDNFGLTFESHRNPTPGQPRLTIKSSKTGKTFNLTEGQLKNGQFFSGDRQFGLEMNKFLKENTLWHQVLQRRSVRKYLVRKHDAKFWCFFACKTKDSIDSKFRDAKTRLKYRMVERTIYPFSTKLGFIMDCIINPDSTRCSAKALRERGIDRIPMTEGEINDLVKEAGDIRESGNGRVSKVLVQKLLEKFMSQAAARTTVSAIPVAGQIYLALVIVDAFDQMDQCVTDNCLSRFAADLNSKQYLEYYTAMRSVGDELKAGVLSADEVGATMDEFQGTHSAEESLVYQAYNNPNKTTASLFGGKVYAATPGPEEKTPYLCANGKPIPAGKLVCSEKKVARTFTVEDIRNNDIVDGIAGMLNKYRCIFHVPVVGTCVPGPQLIIHPTIKAINQVFDTILGPILGGIFSALQAIPGIGDFLTSMQNSLGALIQGFLGKVFPLPVQIDSPGREKYDGLEAGGEVAASEFGKGGYTKEGQPYGLGGKKLNPAEQKAVLQAYNAQQDYDYQHSSFLAKLTSLDNPGSLASRFIAIMPSSFGQLSHRVMTTLSKPFNGLFAFSRPAYAGGTQLVESPFGIPKSGYVVDDPAFTIDPAELTPEYCASAKTAWENSMTEDPLTGIDEYSATNPCLLEQVVVEAGASALTGNDSLDDGIGTPSTPTAPGASAGAVIDVPNLGKNSDIVACAAGTNDLGITTSQYNGGFKTEAGDLRIRLCQLGSIPGSGQNTTGRQINGGGVVNSRVSGAWQALGEKAKADGVTITSYSSFRLASSCGGAGTGSLCARPGKSPHQLGVAIDVVDGHVIGSSTTSCSGRARNPGNATWDWLYNNAELFGLKQYTKESWHWDPLPLGNRCGKG